MDQTREQLAGEPTTQPGPTEQPACGPTEQPACGPTEQPACGPTEQPVGEATDFTGATPPEPTELRGTQVILRPIDPEQGCGAAVRRLAPARRAIRRSGPTSTTARTPTSSLPRLARGAGRAPRLPLPTVTRPSNGKPLGIVSYLSIVPEHGVIEIGNIWFSPDLKRTRAATEAIFLLAQHAFDDLGYRRLEWKCNALNEPSRRAAIRFGFEFEGIFLNHRVVKGRNRDTAWFAITDATLATSPRRLPSLAEP